MKSEEKNEKKQTDFALHFLKKNVQYYFWNARIYFPLLYLDV